MEHSKKVLIYDPEWEHLSALDQQMNEILKKKNLSDSEKAALYLQVAQKYVSFQKPPPPPQPDIPDDSFVGELQRAAPKDHKITATAIYAHLKKHLSWNTDGEIIHQKQMIPDSHIVTLIDDFVRKRRKKKPTNGQDVFYRVLKESRLPSKYDVHHKLSPLLPRMLARRKMNWRKV